MLPLLDKESFELLISEEKDFIVCFSESGEVLPIFREVFERFASKVFILMCSPKSCPSVQKHLSLKVSGAILLFSGGRTMEVILELYNRAWILKRIERFVKFSRMKERIILEEKIFQRSRRKLRSIMDMHYQEMGG